MKRLSEEEKQKTKDSFSKGLDFATRNHIEYVHTYIKRVRPFALNAYVGGVAEGMEVSGYVEAFYVDNEGNLSMVISVDRVGKSKTNEYILFIDTEDFKTFKELKFL